MIKNKDIMEALKKVTDPELGVSIVDLGLVYKVDINRLGRVKVLMTLTTPGCPLAGVIEKSVREAVKRIKGISKVEVEITFDPPWVPDLMNDDCREKLGFN